MNLDLVTNGSCIKTTIDSFLSGKIIWIVLGYINNKTLTVVETGDKSIEDMFEEFDSNKIMYGFVSLIHPDSKLKKNVIIHWQGEAASHIMKTFSCQHFNAIRDLCKPVHVTHVARNSQDLDLDEIMKKMMSCGVNFSPQEERKRVFVKSSSVQSEGNTASKERQNRLKELSTVLSVDREPVSGQQMGCNYEKINAADEIKNLRNNKIGVLPTKTTINTYKKIGASEETSDYKDSRRFSVPSQQISGYKKINPQQELKALNTVQKTICESNTKVQSENNTADRAKEDRKKELYLMVAKRNSITTDDVTQKVGTNYSKVDPVADIRKLRQDSVGNDDVFNNQPRGANYSKVDPVAEIKMLRLASVDNNDVFNNQPKGTTYSKVDPVAEIRKLRQDSVSNDDVFTNQPRETNYSKVDPVAEIRKLKQDRADNDDVFTNQPRGTTYSKVDPVAEIRKLRQDSVSNDDVFTNQPRGTTYSKVDPVAEIRKLKQDRADNDDVFSTQPKHKIAESHCHQKYGAQGQVGPTAIAKYDFNATDSDEISFETDELIKDIEEIDSDWWIGINKAGAKGMFPSNFVELKNDSGTGLISSATKSHVQVPGLPKYDSMTVKGIFDYYAQADDEVSFKEGDTIFNVIDIDEGWWEGELRGGKRGLFPSNHVEIL